jgi:hypothetical protein
MDLQISIEMNEFAAKLETVPGAEPIHDLILNLLVTTFCI